MIANRLNFIKKKDKRMAKPDANKMKNIKLTKREEIAETSMITVVPEF